MAVIYGFIQAVLGVAVVLIGLAVFRRNSATKPDIRRPSTDANAAYGILEDGIYHYKQLSLF